MTPGIARTARVRPAGGWLLTDPTSTYVMRLCRDQQLNQVDLVGSGTDPVVIRGEVTDRLGQRLGVDRAVSERGGARGPGGGRSSA